MTENTISSLQIQKLGHEIQEIRERALHSIHSKIKHGFAFDNDLARSRELLTKLLNWFLFTPCSKEDLVISTIKTILNSESGAVILRHYGPLVLRKEIAKIRTYIDPKYCELLDEVLEFIDNNVESWNCGVPLLETDVPLSYRTDNSYEIRGVESTATLIEGFVTKDSSQAPRSARVEMKTTHRIEKEKINVTNPFKWQVLIEADTNVIRSTEKSLINNEVSALVQPTMFFMNVLLRDFPAEIFLQRPTIVIALFDLLEKDVSLKLNSYILNALLHFTKGLQVRFNQANDPCLYNMKDSVCIENDIFVYTTPRSAASDRSSETSEDTKKINKTLDERNEISLDSYCCMGLETVLKILGKKPDGLTSKVNEVGINLCLLLLEELLNLILLFLNKTIQDSRIVDTRYIHKILIGYGNTLEHLRLQIALDDFNSVDRVVYFWVLYNCTLFLNRSQLCADSSILPRNLKNIFCNALVDIVLAKLYPDLHESILEQVQSFSDLNEDSLGKFEATKRICESMTAAVRYLHSYKSMDAFDGIRLAKKALPSLEFHRNKKYVRYVLDMCTNKLPLYPYNEELLNEYDCVTLGLLSHNVDEIKEVMYKICQRIITESIGIKLNSACSNSQILFLLRPKVFVQLASFGLTSENSEIKKCSEDILIHILKCRLLVSEDIWNRIVEALIISLPVLLVHCSDNTVLGKLLFSIMDPDTAKSMLLPKIEVVKGNIIMLYNQNAVLREEAFSRLCWMLASQPGSRDMLPKLNNLYDKALPKVLHQSRIILDGLRHNQHFYQPSSLYQVLELLKSPKVEPVIRRSAMSQISVMLEDPLLHIPFLQNDGLEIILDVMRLALVESDFQNYPDSIIPAISVLKSLCLCNASVRIELRENIDLYQYILRGVFMFFTEERAKQDASCLLFLLMFNDFIRGSASTGDISIPYFITEKIAVPFVCNTHWNDKNKDDIFALLTSDKWCKGYLQIHWNAEMADGLHNLLFWDEDTVQDDTIDWLRLNRYDFALLKVSSIEHCIGKHLTDIQNGTSHADINSAVEKLGMYVNLYRVSNRMPDESFFRLAWESTFSRFLKTLPSSEQDAKLLSKVLNLLVSLARVHKKSNTAFWLRKAITGPHSCMLDLLSSESSDDQKSLTQDLLLLITTCASQDQYVYSHYGFFKSDLEPWNAVIDMVADTLKFSNTTHFYNLSYLDSLLSCLVHLTAILGWSGAKSKPHRCLFRIVESLCELVVVFHCGKGATSAVSVMGLSITRNAVLILNHVLAEIRHSNVKNWELCFLEMEHEDWLKSFLVLWSSRDVVLRAAILQFFAGLSLSERLTMYILSELKNERGGTWQMTLAVLLDHEEASVVRENAANFLGNLLRHVNQGTFETDIIEQSLVRGDVKKEPNVVALISHLFEQNQFGKNILVILNCLYLFQVIDLNAKPLPDKMFKRLYDDGGNSDGSESSLDSTRSLTTPALVKSLAGLLLNLFSTDRDHAMFQDQGLVKMLFRCIFNPTMDVSDARRLSLHCEILEMNIFVSALLGQLVNYSEICRGTVVHTRDCLNVLFSLLNEKCYHTHLPQLLYLRNQTWCTTFDLIRSVVRSFDCDLSQTTLHENWKDSYDVVLEVVNNTGPQAFLETLTSCLLFSGSTDLQDSALLLLTALLKAESESYEIIDETKQNSLQYMLDNTTISSHAVPEQLNSDDIDDVRDSLNLQFPTKEILRKIPSMTYILKKDESNLAGSMLCKILLNVYKALYLDGTEDLYQKRSGLLSALSMLLYVSKEAKRFAKQNGLAEDIVENLKKSHSKLNLESVDCLRSVMNKKRLSPVLQELVEVVGLLNNFMFGDEDVKCSLAQMGLSNLIHKFWVWFAFKRNFLEQLLKMLSTFTTNCPKACQFFSATVTESGAKRSSNRESFLFTIITHVEKEMEQISKTHDLTALQLCFSILNNCCAITESRSFIGKSNLLQCALRIHPAITKKQKAWENVEFLWLEFLQNFSLYPEGQSCLAKNNDLFELLLTLTSSSKERNQLAALIVIKNLAYYQPNRARLWTSDEFINLIQTKLTVGNFEEKCTTVLVIWSLTANSQKARLILKASGLDVKLQSFLRQCELLPQDQISSDTAQIITYVLNII